MRATAAPRILHELHQQMTTPNGGGMINIVRS
jgi:hypothetical protein